MSGRVIKFGFITMLAITLTAICVMFPALTASGARSGLILCGNIVIPSLFPFCVLALFCEKSGIIATVSRFLAPISSKIFHLSGEKFCVLIISCLAGYPVGSRMICSLYDGGNITEAEAKRMSLYCINAGPAFILTAVGEGILGNGKMGRILFVANIIATLTIAVIAEARHSPTSNSKKLNRLSAGDAFVTATADASRAIFGICGWVILFSALLSLLNCGIMPTSIIALLSTFLEVTTAIIGANCNPLLISAILSFCGLCVHCQVYSILKQAAPKYGIFLVFRAIHAAISVGITYLFIKSDNTVLSVISNNVSARRQNISFTYASAIALILLCFLLVISVSERKKDKLM